MKHFKTDNEYLVTFDNGENKILFAEDLQSAKNMANYYWGNTVFEVEENLL